MWQKQSQELTRVNPDRNIFSINVELTSTFLLYRGLVHHHHRILNNSHHTVQCTIFKFFIFVMHKYYLTFYSWAILNKNFNYAISRKIFDFYVCKIMKIKLKFCIHAQFRAKEKDLFQINAQFCAKLVLYWFKLQNLVQKIILCNNTNLLRKRICCVVETLHDITHDDQWR